MRTQFGNGSNIPGAAMAHSIFRIGSISLVAVGVAKVQTFCSFFLYYPKQVPAFAKELLSIKRMFQSVRRIIPIMMPIFEKPLPARDLTIALFFVTDSVNGVGPVV